MRDLDLSLFKYFVYDNYAKLCDTSNTLDP